MSREPSSPMQRGWKAFDMPPEPPPPEKTEPAKRKFKIRVEPAKPKPKPPDFEREQRATLRRREQVLTKALTTTVQLTAEERGLLRELRASATPNAAGLALARIQEAKRQKRRDR